MQTGTPASRPQGRPRWWGSPTTMWPVADRPIAEEHRCDECGADADVRSPSTLMKRSSLGPHVSRPGLHARLGHKYSDTAFPELMSAFWLRFSRAECTHRLLRAAALHRQSSLLLPPRDSVPSWRRTNPVLLEHRHHELSDQPFTTRGAPGSISRGWLWGPGGRGRRNPKLLRIQAASGSWPSFRSKARS